MWTHKANHLILASASPRRLQLLQQIRVPVEQLVAPAQGEDEPRLPAEPVRDYVVRTAREKLDRTLRYWQSIHINEPAPPMLAADTTVAMGEMILGKPADAADAKRILTALAGHTHEVLTSVVLAFEDQRYEALVTTEVTMDERLALVIDDYIASSEPFGKAGAYGIQGIAAAYVSEIKGSYSAVVGLPLFETAQLLRQAGLYQ